MTRLVACVVLAAGLFVAAVSPGVAQIPNAGFESWGTVAPVMPTGWVTTFTNVTKSAAARSGSGAAQGVAVDVGGGSIVPPTMWSLFPFNQRPATLNGYYQFAPLGSDIFLVTVLLYKAGFPIAGGDIILSGAVNAYSPFSVDIEYFMPDMPDTGYIVISMVGSMDNPPQPGSTYLVDDLSFSGTVSGVAEASRIPASFELQQNFPNPFNPSTTIRFSLAEESFVDLAIYNLVGQEVARLVQEQKPAGEYAVAFDASGLPSGTYLYRLRAGGFTSTRTMALVR
ncbi:MAG TPA: T9SS type A sorting domain-containing protein [Bacteroidota bacterium]|nr:T9SS type A sorting domain-containing protein [Bacteroidota bacterium]